MSHLTFRLAALAVLATACTFDLERELEPGQLTGTVMITDAQGRSVPARDALVRLQPTGLETRTDEAGRFELNELSAGTYLLRCEVDLDGDGRIDAGFLRRDVVIEQIAGATGAADLGRVEAGRLGAIEGRFLDGDAPVAIALVTLRPQVAGGPAERVVATRADGTFRIDAVVPGVWTLEALSEETQAAASGEVTVGASGLARPTLAATPASPGIVTGTAGRSDGGTEPIELALIGRHEAARVTTPPDELFEIEVPPGLYVLVARDTAGKLPPVVLRDLLVTGRLELDRIELVAGDGGPRQCLDLDDRGALVPEQDCTDLDGDGLGDGLDLDADDDGLLDVVDECPLRFDPPGLERRPADCAPYPALSVVVRAPDSVVTGVPFIARVRAAGGIGEVTTALAVVAGEGVTAQIEPLDAGRWTVTASGTGTLTLEGEASDATGTQTAQASVSVTAPGLIVLAETSVTGPVDAPFLVEARLTEPLEDVTWRWTVVDQGPAALQLEDTDLPAVTVLTDTPGTYTLEVEATAGARRGSASITVVVVSPSIAIEADGLNDAGRFELTVGEATPFTFRPALDDVDVTWTSAAELLVTGEDTQLVLEAAQPGTHPLTLTVTKGARVGTLTVEVIAFAVSPITLVSGDTLVVGEAGSLTVAADPLFDDATWTWTALPSNPPGALVTPQGQTLLVSATTPGTYEFRVEARTVRRVARGLVTLHVIEPPLRIATLTTPRPILVRGQTIRVEASSPDLTGAEATTWQWRAHEDNPSAPELTDAGTSTLSFVPDQTGTYRFDLTVVAGERSGSTVVALEVEPPPPLDVAVSWYDNLVGGELYVEAWAEETLSGAEQWRWTQDPANPETLALTHDSPETFSAQPSQAGTYRFTVQVVDGERSGEANVEIEVRPGVAVSVSTSPAAATVGMPLSAWGDWSGSGITGLRWRWEADPSNPAGIVFEETDSSWTSMTFAQPGLYRVTIHLDAFDSTTFEPVSEQASTTIRVYPAIPIEAWADDTPAGEPFVFHARTPDASGLVSWSWRVVEYASSSRPSITNRLTADATVNATRVGDYLLEVTARIGVRESRALVTGTIVAAEDDDDRWVDIPGHASSWVNAPHHGTVGQPLELNAFCNDCAPDTTFTWSLTSGPTGSTLENVNQPKLRFTATQPGTYVFRLQYSGPGYAGSTSGTTVEIAASQPDVYIDGQAGVGTSNESFRSRFWACRSGRTDVESITWQQVGGGLDGVTDVDGAWLHFRPQSLAKRIAAWQCTVTTTGGQTFTLTRPIVVVSHGSRYPDNVVWVKPHEGGEGGGAGTWDDPRQGLTDVLFRCGIICNPAERTFVLTPGVYELDDYYDRSATGIIGSVDPSTFEQDVVAHPSIFRWSEADFANPLWRVNGVHLDGLRIEATAKAGSTHPLVMFGLTSDTTSFVRNIVELRALEGQQAVALQVEASAAAEPRVVVAGNRFRVVGGTGRGALVDNCRGALWAHNLLDVDATSTLDAGLATECDWLHRKRPSQLVNNAIRMGNGGDGFDLWGTPASDTGLVFGGNWFAGTGAFVVASQHVPAPLHLMTAAEVNAVLGGENNSDDPACFGEAQIDLADEGLVEHSSCEGTAVAPSATRTFAFDQVTFDAEGRALNLPQGWSDGTVDPGPRQVF